MRAKSRKTLLLVDDEAIIALSEKVALEKYGYSVILAKTGEEAIALAESMPDIDLILMDINLGRGMDGTQAAEIILRRRDLPVVFLSSHVEPDVVEKTEKITSYGYVVKDSSLTVLDTSIKMAFKLFEAKIKERESNASYRMLFSAASDGILLADSRTKKFRFANPAICRMLGYTEEEFKRLGVEDIHPKESLNEVLDAFRALTAGKIAATSDLPCLRKDGTVFYATISHSVIFLDGRKYQAGFFHDVTERKRAEEELVKRNQYIESILEHMPIGFAANTIDDGAARFLNDNFANIYGWPKDVLTDVDQFFEKVYPGPEGRELKARVIRDMSSGDPEKMAWDDLQITTGTGDRRYISAKNIPLLEQNLMISTVWDTTRAHEAQEALRESTARDRSILNASPDGIAIADKRGRILMVSPATLKIFGYKRDEDFVGRMINDFLVPDDHELAGSNVALMFQGTMTGPGEYRGLRADGSLVDIEVNGEFIRDAEGRPAQMVFVIRDISERKRAEAERAAALAALRESEEWLKDILSNMTDWVWEVDGNGVYTYSSENIRDILGISGKDVIGKTPFDFMPADEAKRVAAVFSEIAANGKPIKDLENWNIGKNGERICLLTNGVPLLDEKGKLIGYRGVDKDITERKLDEEKLQVLLREKEILLQEVHHRIRNNIHAMMGLLMKQADAHQNPESKAILMEARNRLQSMGVLYDRLYRSENLREMSLRDYLPSLVDAIINVFPDKDKVKIDKRIDDVIVGVKILSPLGIILNELLTNAMKHAFTGRTEGLITITASAQDRHVTIIVEDDGNGIPESVDMKSSGGLGLGLVNMLTAQIDGSVRIDRRKGARFILEFDKPA